MGTQSHVSPALAGRFLSTEPPGKLIFFLLLFINHPQPAPRRQDFFFLSYFCFLFMKAHLEKLWGDLVQNYLLQEECLLLLKVEQLLFFLLKSRDGEQRFLWVCTSYFYGKKVLGGIYLSKRWAGGSKGKYPHGAFQNLPCTNFSFWKTWRF